MFLNLLLQHDAFPEVLPKQCPFMQPTKLCDGQPMFTLRPSCKSLTASSSLMSGLCLSLNSGLASCCPNPVQGIPQVSKPVASACFLQEPRTCILQGPCQHQGRSRHESGDHLWQYAHPKSERPACLSFPERASHPGVRLQLHCSTRGPSCSKAVP